MRWTSSSLVALLLLLLTTSCVPAALVDPHAVPPPEELERLAHDQFRAWDARGTPETIRISAAQPWQDGFLVAFTAETSGWYEDGCLYYTYKQDGSRWTVAGGGIGGGVGPAAPAGVVVRVGFLELGPEAVALYGPVLSSKVAVVEVTDETGARFGAVPNNGGFLLVLSPVQAVRRIRALDKFEEVLQDAKWTTGLGKSTDRTHLVAHHTGARARGEVQIPCTVEGVPR